MIRPESTTNISATSLEEYHYIKIFIDIDEPYKNVSRERERLQKSVMVCAKSSSKAMASDISLIRLLGTLPTAMFCFSFP